MADIEEGRVIQEVVEVGLKRGIYTIYIIQQCVEVAFPYVPPEENWTCKEV